MTEVAIYDRAKHVLAEYRDVDQVKDYRDKAKAVEIYAKQAKDYQLEHDASVARVRAERRCGELLLEMEKSKGGGEKGVGRAGNNAVAPTDRINHPKTLKEIGVSKDQSSKWQKLAQVPEKEFEDACDVRGSVSTQRVLNPKLPTEPKPKMDKRALWWWGTLTRMERDGNYNLSVAELLEEMTDSMRRDAEPAFKKLQEFLSC